MPHCHRGGGGGGFGGISSVRRSWTVWELWLLCIHGWNIKKKGEKKKKRGILSLYIPPEQPGVHSVSQQKGKNWICNSYIFVVVCSLGEGYLLLLHLLLALDTICVTNGAKGETHQHAAPHHHHLLSSPSSPLPPLRAEEHRRGERMSRTLRV